mgnify:FL=1
MKKSFSKVLISFFLLSTFTGIVYATKYLAPLSFTLSNQPRYKYSFEEGRPILEKTGRKSIQKENLRIKWGAVFSYPYRSTEYKEIHLDEDNLEWKWREEGNRLIGETSIESCPVTVEYFIQENILISKVSFTNTTENILKDLNYVFEINFPPNFVVSEGKILTSKGNRAGEIVITTGGYEGRLESRYDGKEKSSANYLVYIGNVEPNQTNNAMIELKYQ